MIDPMSLRAAVLLTCAAGGLWARHLPIQVFTPAPGLPRNSVECLVPGPNGFLWICTSAGLVRFDGYRFRVFDTNDGLPSMGIVDFVPSRKGGFWVVSDRGVCRLPPGGKIGETCRLLPVDHPSGQFTGHTLFESTTGETWVATTDALFHLSADGRSLERSALQLPPHHMVLALADGQDGTVLVSTNFEIFEWKSGAAARNLSESVGPIGARQLIRVAPDEIWVVSGKCLYRIILQGDRREIRKEPVERQPSGSYVALRRRDGAIWTAGFNGIRRLSVSAEGRVRETEHYTMADGLPALDISFLAEDSQGNLWGEAEGSGIFRMADSGFVSYDGNDGLGNARIASIFEDRFGRLCVQRSWNGGPDVLVKPGGRFRSIPIRHAASLQYLGWGWNQWVSTGQGLLHSRGVRSFQGRAASAPRSLCDQSPRAR